MMQRDPAREGAKLLGALEMDEVSRKMLAAQLDTDEGTLSKIFHGKQIPEYLFLYRMGRKVERMLHTERKAA